MLIFFLDIENTRDEVSNLSRVVNIDHVEAHLFREKRVVFTELLHLAYKGSSQSLYLIVVIVFVVQIADCRNYWWLLGDEFLYLETLESGDEYIDATVWKIDFFMIFAAVPT